MVWKWDREWGGEGEGGQGKEGSERWKDGGGEKVEEEDVKGR